MATIRFYKYELIGNTEHVYRYTIPNLETLNIQYNTPISPMPLPEENVKENILVKIEGNSASIDIEWVLAQNDYTIGSNNETCLFAEWNSEADVNDQMGVDNNNVRGKFDPVGLTFKDMLENSKQPSKQVQIFKEKFESTSLNNDFLITIEDGDNTGYGLSTDPMRIYGSPSQMSFNISGSSPIVWRARIQFFEGNVITVFDPDSPESPQNLSMVGQKDYGTTPYDERDVFKIRFQDPTSFGATDTHTATISYRRAGKLQWHSVSYGIETTQGTNGSSGVNGKLTKINDGGADHGYYVIYLPAAAHETDAAKNSFLTNTGLFNTATSSGGYGHSGISHTMVGVDSNGDRESQFYDIKVYFENSAGDGGTAEESAKTVE